ncbi:hypothetical protein NEOLEDRAFT_1127800 [Neolentinus lepideus HHB14362 ss-1]|uniref:Protein ARV n=1 Tax=Neolentinus lepideus HHB14362 ss-1 TaxID=1314782 RepID=A0A165VMM0_9AGAM|nr:hypothetical protein NEOLEDRAFT_1127800 [Neolentinus lepideus HHB14362 ss-1]
MPVCTICTHPIPYLYTVYESAYNLRLEQCPACHVFADPYVEHDELTLTLDLILLKRDVFRHLLFNRGTGPRKATPGRYRNGTGASQGAKDSNGGSEETEGRAAMTSDFQLEQVRRLLIYKLGSALVLVDAIIRWAHLHPEKPLASTNLSLWTTESCITFLRILTGCLVETVAFHLGIIAACYIVMACVDKWRAWRHPGTEVSGIRQQFRLSHVPLTLLYSSLTKLFLLLLLSVWRPVVSNNSSSRNFNSEAPAYSWNSSMNHPIITTALEIFDEDKLDRDWVIRNVLGGMAAGFGLRVVLDCHPIFTTLVIVFGWFVKTTVATFVSGWVGGDVETGTAWLAYSIP